MLTYVVNNQFFINHLIQLYKMNFDCITYYRENDVAIIKLNRPQVLNATNRQMWLDIRLALEDIKNDPNIKVLIITGEGRSFSSGADLNESKERSVEEYRDYLFEVKETTRQIINFDKPIIAAINGYAIGSGHYLSLACDIRIIAEDAKIGSPEAQVASSNVGGASILLQNLIGSGKARELLFTADLIDGKEAERIGLVNKAVPLNMLMEKAMEMAQKISENDSFSIKMMKKGLNMSPSEMSLDALMDYEIEACLACISYKKSNISE